MRMRSTVRPSSWVLPSSCACPALIASRNVSCGVLFEAELLRVRTLSVFGGTNRSVRLELYVPPILGCRSARAAERARVGICWIRAVVQEDAVAVRRRSVDPDLALSACDRAGGPFQVDVVSHFMCRTVSAGGVSAASALARKPGELLQGAVTRSATAVAIASVAAVRSRRFRPRMPLPAPTTGVRRCVPLLAFSGG